MRGDVAWLLPLVTLGCVSVMAARWLGGLGGLAAGTTVCLVALAVVAALAPVVGSTLVPSFASAMVLLSAVASLPRGKYRMSPPAASTLVAAAGPALVAVGLAVVGAGGVSWSLLNDGQLHLLGTRVMLQDGGLRLDRGNRDPLVNEVLAVFTGPGRGGVDPDSLLAHDAARQAMTVLLLLGWLSVLVGAVLAMAVPAERRWTRAGVASVGALVPWTWFVGGFALRYGFVNAITTIIVLTCSWALWRAGRSQPVIASGALMLATTGALVSWAMAAFVPMALGVAMIAWKWREHRAARSWLVVWWLGCLLVSAAYVVGVTARTIAPAGTVGLSGEGAFPSLAPWQVVVLAIAVASTACLLPGADRSHRAVGAVAVLVGSGIGLGLILLQRTGDGASLWGYYPQKLAWVLAVLWVVMVIESVVRAAAVDLRRRRDRFALPLVTVGAAAAAMLVVPPTASPLVGHGVAWAFPALTVVDGSTGTSRDDLGAVENAFALLPLVDRPGARIIFTGFIDDEIGEQWADDWSVQLAGQRGDAVSRRSIGNLDLREAGDVCRLARLWGQGVVAHTTSAALRDELGVRCPDVTVELS